MSDKLYNVGIYIRLSRENTAYADGDSMSIENQQSILSKVISMMPGWVETRTYIDNGASGGNFNRRGFRDMMTDVRNGDINLVLVHDLSRFGRNYLESGKYLEEELPSLGCRFVALTDGIDTDTGENDIMPFLNAMNDYYLKNISDRIKAVFHAKAKDGQKLTGTAPYGYMRNPDDNTRLIVDDYAAAVVRRIFEMRADGMGYTKIAVFSIVRKSPLHDCITISGRTASRLKPVQNYGSYTRSPIFSVTNTILVIPFHSGTAGRTAAVSHGAGMRTSG